MLINATQEEEVRVALVDGNKLYDLDIESPEHANKKSNIYKGIITRIEPSLEAAFVDYGVDRHGFLPLKEIAREYYPEGTNFNDHSVLKSSLREGQEVIVQIEKEERGQKGAALTTFISLAGSYLVLMPNNPRAGGISRRIEGEDRAEIRAAFEGIDIPRGMGVIIRTAGVGKSSEELSWDLSILTKLWEMIKKAASTKKAPFLIHQESSIAIRAIRDYLRPDIGEILVDSKEVYEHIIHHIKLVRPEFSERVHLYRGDIPLFSKYQIESQIESAYLREVRLPSGGAIVIDPTEALTSIDVNSAKATRGGDIEETALQTNIEAAEEIARQLCLRDVGGLVVIDFIDMTPIRNQREIENRMREACRQDRARIQFSRISRFGLLEMSRQRLRPSLEESTSHVCPMCQGQGTIRDTASLALSIMRLVEEEAHKEHTGDVMAFAPVEIATFILNNKRRQLESIEKTTGIKVTVIPDPHMMAPAYEVHRVLNNAQNLPLDCSNDDPSEILRERAAKARAEVQENLLRREFASKKQQQPRAADTPMVYTEDITINSPAPTVIEGAGNDPHTINLASGSKASGGAVISDGGKAEPAAGGVFSKLFSFIGSIFKGGEVQEPKKEQSNMQKQSAQKEGNGSQSRDSNRRGGQGQRRNNGSNDKRRNDRGERPSREERDRRKSERFERAERPTRSDRRDERNERPNREERAPRNERQERPTREERAPRQERAPRPERKERMPRQEREVNQELEQNVIEPAMQIHENVELTPNVELNIAQDSNETRERSERPARQERPPRKPRATREDIVAAQEVKKAPRAESEQSAVSEEALLQAVAEQQEREGRLERPRRERKSRNERAERSERPRRERGSKSKPKSALNARTVGINDAEIFDIENLTSIRLFTFAEDDFTFAPMGQGPDKEVAFPGLTEGRDFSEGLEFKLADQAGGYNEAEVSAEVEDISEPAEIQLHFSENLPARAFDDGVEFVKVDRAAGLHAAIHFDECDASLTMGVEEAQKLLDEQFNSRPEPTGATLEPLVSKVKAVKKQQGQVKAKAVKTPSPEAAALAAPDIEPISDREFAEAKAAQAAAKAARKASRNEQAQVSDEDDSADAEPKRERRERKPRQEQAEGVERSERPRRQKERKASEQEEAANEQMLDESLNALLDSASTADDLDSDDDGRPQGKSRRERASKRTKAEDQSSVEQEADTLDETSEPKTKAKKASKEPRGAKSEDLETKPRANTSVYDEVDADDTSDEHEPEESVYEHSRLSRDFWSSDRNNRLSARYARVLRDEQIEEEIDKDARTRNIRSAITETVSSFDDSSVLDSTIIDGAGYQNDGGYEIDEDKKFKVSIEDLTATFDFQEVLDEADVADMRASNEAYAAAAVANATHVDEDEPNELDADIAERYEEYDEAEEAQDNVKPSKKKAVKAEDAAEAEAQAEADAEVVEAEVKSDDAVENESEVGEFDPSLAPEGSGLDEDDDGFAESLNKAYSEFKEKSGHNSQQDD